MNALIAFYLKRDPSEMTDEEFVIAYNQVEFCLDLEQKRVKSAMYGS